MKLAANLLICFSIIFCTSCQAPQQPQSVVDAYYEQYIQKQDDIDHLKVAAILKTINSHVANSNYQTYLEFENYLKQYLELLSNGGFISNNYTLTAGEDTIIFTFSFTNSTKGYYLVQAEVEYSNFPPQLIMNSKQLIDKINSYEFQNPE